MTRNVYENPLFRVIYKGFFNKLRVGKKVFYVKKWKEEITNYKIYKIFNPNITHIDI